MTSLDHHFERFVARLRMRLDAGAKAYGNRSFSRPANELVDEIQQELEDVAGWGLILWMRLEGLHELADRLDQGGCDAKS